MSEDKCDFKVIRRIDNEVVMRTDNPKCIYQMSTIKELAANGYKVFLNGKVCK